MDINTAKEALLKRSNAFQERYFTAYGQLVLRVNEETYISSRENLRLSKLTEKDFDLFDIGVRTAKAEVKVAAAVELA